MEMELGVELELDNTVKPKAATDMSTRCECGKQVSPSLDVCEL